MDQSRYPEPTIGAPFLNNSKVNFKMCIDELSEFCEKMSLIRWKFSNIYTLVKKIQCINFKKMLSAIKNCTQKSPWT